MRVGVYVDGYNLYYGARSVCGRGTPGWRWLDIRALAKKVIEMQGSWSDAVVERVVYCTARVDATISPSAHADQDVYLQAIRKSGSVDRVEFGNYVARAKKGLLATTDPSSAKPQVFRAQWPVRVRDLQGAPVEGAEFMVQYLHLEEKGSDVNVAAHLLIDVLTGAVDAAMVISNDSDLAFPLKEARKHVPVATVSPRQSQTAGALMGEQSDGCGGHWWWKINGKTFKSCQLPDPVGGQSKPDEW